MKFILIAFGLWALAAISTCLPVEDGTKNTLESVDAEIGGNDNYAGVRLARQFGGYYDRFNHYPGRFSGYPGGYPLGGGGGYGGAVSHAQASASSSSFGGGFGYGR